MVQARFLSRLAACMCCLAFLVATASFQQPEELRSFNGELNVTLVVTVARITEGPFSWNHRSYDGLSVGRTWRVKPGDTLRVLLVNRLGSEPPDAIGQFFSNMGENKNHNWTGDWLHDGDVFSLPNHTNLHLHGMRVSPKDNHDNIMRDCAPQTNMSYEFKIPDNHPRGTFWYHPHVHRSGALQLASGMVGALIVDDDNEAHIDIAAGANRNALPNMDEVLMVLHEVSHSHFPTALQTWVNPTAYFAIDQPRWASGDRLPLDKHLDEDKYPSFKNCGGNKMWPNTSILNIPQRFEPLDCAYALVNGFFRPQLPMMLGVWQRWRLVQSSHDSAIRIQVGKGCEALVVARDGWYFDAPKNVTGTPVVIAAGSRADFAIRCHVEGLVDVKMLTGGIHEGNVWNAEIPRELYEPVIYPQTLVTINVTAEGAPNVFLHPKPVLGVGDADYAMKLPPKTHASLMDSPVDRKFTVLYNLTGWGATGRVPKVIGQFFNGGQFMINGKSFTNRTEHCMVRGEVEEWTIFHGHSRLDRWVHSFHIHQNWFQIVSQDLGIPGQVLVEDLAHGEWRDTVQIPVGGSVTVRLRFDDITGVFPFHCHVADHQDTGMIQLLQVVDKASQCPEGTLSPKLMFV